ncbi:MAG: IS110 family transposase, partial [Thalassotalea sp.]|nr:IS110 family transposase [Thalassotalea sp.]
IGMSFCPVKSVEQQSIQSITVVRKALDKQENQLGNQIRALVYEYGIAIKPTKKALNEAVVIYSASDNDELPTVVKELLLILKCQYQYTKESLKQVTAQLEQIVKHNDECKRLMNLEGIGVVTAAGLVANLSKGSNFQNGREASVYMGVTPKQYSSGGKVVMLGIDKRAGDKQLKSNLYMGALSYISKLPPVAKTNKQQWLINLVQRAGVKKACIALVNKNIRTAWAMLKYSTEYKVVTEI